ncbi:MAG TPA: hypothetical protein VHC39_00785 [Rhizomicrobium sp.]|nr:hypothetical protein [Rhizomicrobium sp.]
MRNTFGWRYCRGMKVQVLELVKIFCGNGDRKKPTARYEGLTQKAVIRICVIVAIAKAGHECAGTDARDSRHAMQMGLDSGR